MCLSAMALPPVMPSPCPSPSSASTFRRGLCRPALAAALWVLSSAPACTSVSPADPAAPPTAATVLGSSTAPAAQPVGSTAPLPPAVGPSLERRLAAAFPKYRIETRSSEERQPNGTAVRSTTYNFQSGAPVRTDERGKYFYRFSFHISQHPSASDAQRHFRHVTPSPEQARAPEFMIVHKSPSYHLLDGTSVYALSAECLMGRHVAEVWSTLLDVTLDARPPQPGTQVLQQCGGWVDFR